MGLPVPRSGLLARAVARRWGLRTVMGTVPVGEKTQLWVWDSKCGPGVEKQGRGHPRMLGVSYGLGRQQAYGWWPEGAPLGTHLQVPSVALYCTEQSSETPKGGIQGLPRLISPLSHSCSSWRPFPHTLGPSDTKPPAVNADDTHGSPTNIGALAYCLPVAVRTARV